MVWLVNMADTDRPKRNSTEAASPQQDTQEREWGVKVFMMTFRRLWSLLSLTDITCLQPWRLPLPPVFHRTTEASPVLGSTSRSTSSDRSSPPRRPGGRSRRCPRLVLPLKMTMKRVSAEWFILYIFVIPLTLISKPSCLAF